MTEQLKTLEDLRLEFSGLPAPTPEIGQLNEALAAICKDLQSIDLALMHIVDTNQFVSPECRALADVLLTQGHYFFSKLSARTEPEHAA